LSRPSMRILIFLLPLMCAFAQSPEERTRQALDLVLARKYQEFYELFSPEMKKAITLETYSQQADRILAQGNPKSIGAPTVQIVQGSPLVIIPIHWTSVSLNFLVSWNREGKIQGHVLPAGQAGGDRVDSS
jgi:hypothetical protein